MCIHGHEREDYVDDSTIGKINFIDSGFQKLGTCEIHVYGKEGDRIPHFHIISETGEQIYVCIFDNIYLVHDVTNGALSIPQCEQLNYWLNQPCKHLPQANNWEIIRANWFQCNETPDEIIKKYMSIKQPNYSEIIGYKIKLNKENRRV